MKKNTKAKSSTSIKLILSGVVILALSPLVQAKIVEYLTKDCPFFGSHRECGLEVGLKNALNTQTLLGLWIAVGVVLIGIGLYKYFSLRKNR